ncbi:MAG: WYL domain-containing protein [Bacteroidales bacterium]
MTNHGTLHRYNLELKYISQGQYPSLSIIIEYLLNQGFSISERTLQRDFTNIRNEFDIEIEYHNYKNGYYINLEKSTNIDEFFKYLELANTVDILTKSLHDSKKMLNYIDFDNHTKLRGIDNLTSILKALNESKKISFNHINYHHKTNKYHIIKPYLMKEYQNRWYIMGIPENESLKKHEFRTYGIDRISNLKIEDEIFERDETINPKLIFSEMIGLTYTFSDSEEIILSFNPTQGNYIKSLPMHHSQKILIDNDEEFRISLWLRPNYELQNEILKFGKNIKVLKPKWLADTIKEEAIKIANQY